MAHTLSQASTSGRCYESNQPNHNFQRLNVCRT